MIRSIVLTTLPTRLLLLARDAFEVGVALHYDAPWERVD